MILHCPLMLVAVVSTAAAMTNSSFDHLRSRFKPTLHKDAFLFSSHENTTGIESSRRDLQDSKIDIEKELTVGAFSSVPFAGPFLGTLVAALWPGDSPSLWDQIAAQVKQEIKTALLNDKLNDAHNFFIAAKEKLDNYQSSANKDHWISILLSDMIDMHKDLDMRIQNGKVFFADLQGTLFGKSRSRYFDEGYFMLEMSKDFAMFHLAVLKEVFLHGESFYQNPDKSTWLQQLERYATDYDTYFDYMKAEWVAWRTSKFTFKRHVLEEQCAYFLWIKLNCMTISRMYTVTDSLGERHTERIACRATQEKYCAGTKAQILAKRDNWINNGQLQNKFKAVRNLKQRVMQSVDPNTTGLEISLPGRAYLTLCEVEVFSESGIKLELSDSTQSSTGWGGVSSRAIDGNTSGDYGQGSCTHTAGELRPWWYATVHHNPDDPPHRIKVYNRDSVADRLRGFIVKLDEKVVYTAPTNVDKSVYEFPHVMSARSTTGIEISLPGRAYLTLCEVEVFSESGIKLELSDSTQSSTGWGGVSSRAIDGNTSGDYGQGSCTHTAGELRPWWYATVHHNPDDPPHRIKVYNRDSNADRLRGFIVKLDEEVVYTAPTDVDKSVYEFPHVISAGDSFALAPQVVQDCATSSGYQVESFRAEQWTDPAIMSVRVYETPSGVASVKFTIDYPTILLLSAYEKTTWNVEITGQATRIVAFGYEQQLVNVVGNATAIPVDIYDYEVKRANFHGCYSKCCRGRGCSHVQALSSIAEKEFGAPVTSYDYCYRASKFVLSTP